MWDLPGPGLKPVSPALAGGFLTTVPPGKPQDLQLIEISLTLSFGEKGASEVNSVLLKGHYKTKIVESSNGFSLLPISIPTNL